MVKTRILFVDDDPNITSGLRRMLRSWKNSWEAEYFTSSIDALQRMDQQHFDVVVTDMRMPIMDGAQFLAEVIRNHPYTVRIVLSGQSDRSQIMRALGKAHQYLSKPCDAANLHETISRACLLRDRLPNDELKSLVSRIDTIASDPDIFREFILELSRANTTTQKIGKLVLRDIGLSAKVMQLVNSSFFGQPLRGVMPDEAVEMLGTELLRNVASHGGFAPYEELAKCNFQIVGVNQHCQEVAKMSRQIAQVETANKHIHSDSFLAGLMHDIGKIVLAANLPEKYQLALNLAKSTQISLWQAEVGIFGVTHAEVGSYLLGLWGFPQSVVEAVSHYRRPMDCEHREFSPLTTLHLANIICRNHSLSDAREHLLYASEYLKELDFQNLKFSWNKDSGLNCSTLHDEELLLVEQR